MNGELSGGARKETRLVTIYPLLICGLYHALVKTNIHAAKYAKESSSDLQKHNFHFTAPREGRKRRKPTTFNDSRFR